MTEPIQLQDVLALLTSDPMRAADEMCKLADQLRAGAEELRARHSDPFKVPGGLSDRVRMSVVGPNGEVKQRIDTDSN